MYYNVIQQEIGMVCLQHYICISNQENPDINQRNNPGGKSSHRHNQD